MSCFRELMLINGEEAESASGRWMSVENPSERGSVFAEVPCADRQDVDRAVRAADAALRVWKRTPAIERREILLRIADAVAEQRELLARTVSSEDGNIIRYTRDEVLNARDKFRYYASLATELKGAVYPSGNGSLLYSTREPLGVIGMMMPWNSPLALATAKIAPALITGNTVVIKVPRSAPVGVLKMAKIANRFLPPGVLNVLTGVGEECGEALARHPLVRCMSFTGSTEAGRKLMCDASVHTIRPSMSLTGKNAQIIFPDANDEEGLNGVCGAIHIERMGQSCAGGTRIYIHRSIFDSFVDKLTARLSANRLGNALDEATDIGPIANRPHFEFVLRQIRRALDEGHAALRCGGLPPSEGPLAKGYFVEPTVFTCPDNNTLLAKEDIFGPVVVCIPWDDEAQVQQMVNDCDFGLVAYIWTHRTGRAMRMSEGLDVGTVIINFLGGPTEGHPYGGVKGSGYSRENCLEGVLETYTQLKAVTVNMDY